MAGELLCSGIMLSFISYGDLFRRMRRVTHDTFGPHASEQFQPLQQREAVRLVSELVDDPDNWDEIVKRSTSSNILTATYGWPRLTDEHMPLVKRIHAHTAHLSNACIPGTSMVDLFPFLNYLPAWMAKFKRDALAWHQRESEMFEGFNADVARKMFQRADLGTILSSAGAETTTASVAAFLLAMIHYPEIMRKAQAQIDAVVGRDCVPTFADRVHLPYIRAIVKELLRWRPAGPMGIPQYILTRKNFDLSVSSMKQEPQTFLLRICIRWATARLVLEGGKISRLPQGHEISSATISTCVGVTFATQSLFIDFALLLWAFNIEKARDAQGNEITPSLTDVVDAGVTV
ncbi:hypothetical protein DXG01_010515 [Tephrocybe rancida]|nr:hypothetical protein DXG01_010515 [Tephrocybe rancida]